MLRKISLKEFKTSRRLTPIVKERYELFKQANKRSKSCINCSYDSPTSVQDSTKIKKDGVSMFVAVQASDEFTSRHQRYPMKYLINRSHFYASSKNKLIREGWECGQIWFNLFVEFNSLVDAFDRRVGTVRDIPYPRRAHPLVLVVIVKYMRSLLF